jgi:Glycosyl transferase family 2/Sulfotransferase family
MASLTRSVAVCALVPHHDGPEWLPAAIDSLLAQTRPPDAIVVLDDASADPPLDAAARYPEVTFLRSAENVGPYRLVQTAIELTAYDAYLFQDADDVSHPQRLETLLDVAEAHGADMVGSHETELDVAAPEARGREYPLDVNRALAGNPIAFALLHPTSLVARDVVVRAGGFPGGLRFSGDVDFLWRAGHVARIVNADRHLYVRRRHPSSLTCAAATGTRSAARRRLDHALRSRARANAARISAGMAPDLTPFRTAAPVELAHLSGPPLGTDGCLPARQVSRAGSGRGPVLVVGGPRNGGDVLACALDLHPRLERVPDTGTLAVRTPTRARPVLSGPSVAADALELADRHPDAKLICLRRDLVSTVVSVQGRPDAHGDFYSVASAHAATVELNRVCDLLSAALGPDRVLPLALAELVADPHGAVTACLRFLGEEPAPAVVLPLVGLRAAARPLPPGAVSVTGEEARRLLGGCDAPAPANLAGRLRRLVQDEVDENAVVAVVSRGDDALLDLGPARTRHFPATDDGSYAGEYPATGDAAVHLLEEARARGATHLLVPAPAAWWLTHYWELGEHLDRRYQAVAGAEATGTLYDLRVSVRAVR